MGGNELFDKLRKENPVFRYRGFSLRKNGDKIEIEYDFSADGVCEFHPKLTVPLSGAVNQFDSPLAKEIVFSMGMVELVSYWKALCQPRVIVECGSLDGDDILWWKKLYYNGLGEFFYRNGIETDFSSFMTIDCTVGPAGHEPYEYTNLGLNIVPVGGGKDSDVTLELLSSFRDKNRPFTVNSQKARTDAIHAAGYTDEQTVCTGRTIDPALLRLNAEGCLNGHTPFSAVVAFLGYYCAYLYGGEYIVLSNEASANDGNVKGTSINHQYSKSYEFETDFYSYTQKHFSGGDRGNVNIKYFSILRGFSEIQIAKKFASLSKYHDVFRSCNAGSKKNVWCCNCPKCLFVYCILSPFISLEELSRLFGSELLSRDDLTDVFDGLVGINDVKPFECVGTTEEICLALSMTARRLSKKGMALPALLKHFSERFDVDAVCSDRSLLTQFNSDNNIPQVFMPAVKEMHSFVSSAD